MDWASRAAGQTPRAANRTATIHARLVAKRLLLFVLVALMSTEDAYTQGSGLFYRSAMPFGVRSAESLPLGYAQTRLFPEHDPGPEQELRARLKRAIFTATPDVDARTVVIVAMANATGMLKKVFDKKKLKDRKKRLEKLTSGQIAGAATKEAVDAVHAAIAVAVMVPVITSAST